MFNNIHVPNLQSIGGSLTLIGQQNVSEENFPKLKNVGGDLHLALSGFTKLPDTLEFVGGNVYLIQEPDSLVKSCLEKKRNGVIKGDIYLIGGQVSRSEDGTIEYEEKIRIA